MVFENIVLVAARIGLLLTCRVVALPFLYGQARQASLDPNPGPGDGQGSDNYELLPQPSTSLSAGTVSRLSSLSVSSKGSASSRRVQEATAIFFSFAFEEAAILFVLVLLEAAQFDRNVLRAHWRIDLAIIIACVSVLVPLSICVLLGFRTRELKEFKRSHVFSSGLLFIAWAVLFLKVPIPAALSSEAVSFSTASLVRICVIGTVIIGVLSGSGAISAAIETYEACTKKRKSATQGDVRMAEASFQRTCSDLAARKAQLEQLQKATQTGPQPSFFARMTGSSKNHQDVKALSLEIVGLEALAKSMRDDLAIMRTSAQEAQFNKTVQGRFILLLTRIFGVYCAFRLVLSLLNLTIIGYANTEKPPPDFISLGLTHLVKLFDVDLDVAVWTRQISLGMIGLLILLRIRTILGYLAAVFSSVSASVSTSVLILVLAEIMCVYFLATLIQFRSTLPASITGEGAKGPDAPLLASLPSYQVGLSSLFDGSFLLAGVVTYVHHIFTFQSDPVAFGARD
ncbi:hypothetical protein OC846_000036 [Tilletia horrida]|uniref:Abscisic acid G-protein coupled receptor-like domain-containing protein n=1 Tax=Tilletia horrida TaxID=155126 RepID=A0AAN6JV08_9BASI|nr:hypothetical protein OC846_000036 [Tilletia horrida]KAK0569181.1 hypothetical protein OC861_001217 [Tilletia horrida]